MDSSLCLGVSLISCHQAASLPPVSVPTLVPCVPHHCLLHTCFSSPPHPQYPTLLGEPLLRAGWVDPCRGVRKAALTSFCPSELLLIGCGERESLRGPHSYLQGPSARSPRPGVVSWPSGQVSLKDEGWGHGPIYGCWWPL